MISCISYLFRFVRWNHFLHILCYKVPFFTSLRIYIAGFALTTTPGKAGEALRTFFLSGYGVPYRTSFGALLAERLSDLLAVVLLTIGGLFVYPEGRIAIGLSASFIIFTLYTVQQDAWLRRFENWSKKLLPQHAAHSIEFLIETILAFRACFKAKTLLYGTILGVMAWGLEGTALFFILDLLHASIPLSTAIFIHAFALLVGAITFLPGGLGGTEIVMYQLLILNDVPPTIAAAATLLIRLCTLWFSVVLGLICLPKHRHVVK